MADFRNAPVVRVTSTDQNLSPSHFLFIFVSFVFFPDHIADLLFLLSFFGYFLFIYFGFGFCG